MHHPKTSRRRALALAAALSLAALGAQAQGTPRPVSTLGIFSLLGDGLQITLPGDSKDTRLDRSVRESLPTRDIGFDQAALRAVTDYMARQRPGTQLQMFRATTPLSLEEQRALAEGATRAELPAWMVQAVNDKKLSHLLIITRHRGDASFPVEDGFSVGNGTVEGIGFYLDGVTPVRNRDTGLPSTGFLGTYTMIRVQLMDAMSGQILATQDIRAGIMHAGRKDTEAENVWNALSPTEKVDVLRQMVQQNMTRVLPSVMSRA